MCTYQPSRIVRRSISCRHVLDARRDGPAPQPNAQPNPQESAKPLNGTGAQPKISDPNSTIRLEAEAGQKFAASRNFLNAFFVLEGALLVMIGQAPARLDAEERAAIGPKREIRNLR